MQNWPIKVGGIYLLQDRAPLALRITAIVGDEVHYIHHVTEATDLHAKGAEYGPGVTKDFAICYMCHPEDQSPIPELLEALKWCANHLKQIEERDYPDEPEEARIFTSRRAALAAIARVEAA